MQTRPSVTSAEFVRNFGLWQERALLHPIGITHHGRERLVLIAAEVFQDMPGAAAAQSAQYSQGQARLASVLDNMSEGFIALSEELAIVQVNRVAEAYLGVYRDDLLGRTLAGAFPVLEGSVLIDRIRRVVRSREPIKIETDHFVFETSLVALQIFPIAEGVGLLFDNLTEQAELEQALDASKSLSSALEGHPHIAAALCDAAGRFLDLDEKFAHWLRFERAALLNARLFDLVAPFSRSAIISGFETVSAERKHATLSVQFLARDLEERTLELSLSPGSANSASVRIVATVGAGAVAARA